MAPLTSTRLLLLKKKLLLLKKKHQLTSSKAKKRRFWVHPINQKRDDFGIFAQLFQELRSDHVRFQKYFRMTLENFDYLLRMIGPVIAKQDTIMRKSICPELKLAITLHHLAEGASQNAIASHYKLGRSTTSPAIYETLDVIWRVLQHIYLATPCGPTQRKDVARG